jgi:hypothetical protein
VTFALLTLSTAHAEDAELPDEAPLEIHGFVSQGFVKTTENNYLADSERGSFEFTEVGLNLTKSLSDDLRVGIQLFARDIGPLGNYQPQFDWFYLDYHFADWLGLRAGRTKLPFGLYNETSDIDAARVPVLLPPSLYPIQNREALLAQTGAELYGLVPLGAAGDLEYRFYGGTIYLDTSNASIELRDFQVPYMAGGRLHWLPPVQGLTLGASLQALRLDLDYRPTDEENQTFAERGLLPEGYDGTVSLRAPVKLWIASIEYQLKDLVLASELGATRIDVESSLLNSDRSTLSEGFYVMASYRVRPWFTPGVYYSLLRADVANRSGRAEHQHDVALTLRYDLQAHWLLKLEGHYMHGTAGLNVQLNDGKSRDKLKEDWAVLLVKTTAYF